ncbi:hypothetical protein C1J03_00730 [Sulfitobacter sp. SK012]|uniref:hypothetical protein n=1 Tax=Sulfitobacter sp. SK012 TaxID=1389005 RepID=UPI000E0B01C0|nr:hypothetical protein [Sulfitobacter sp. SK012]AXI44682.1 hypothetical protein C1J03_00730 [Sulfitobacter sp. SK012]
MRPDSHTRTVTWLKVAFPLAALGILSTLFLLSRTIDTESAIPFADKEIQERLRDQQVTAPFFSGSTADGDQLSFSAVKLTTPSGQLGANEAEGVLARIETADGNRIKVQANMARFDIAADMADLEGDVVLETSSGYRMTTRTLTSQMSSFEINAPDAVHAVGPLGVLDAGSMTIKTPQAGENVQLIFNNGVKLVYTPN